jgi:hypothetical protein
MNKPESARSIIIAAVIAVAMTALVVAVVQVAARLITGKMLGGVAIAVGVPVAFMIVWSRRMFGRRKSR